MSDKPEYMRGYMRTYRQGLVEEAKAMLGGECVRCGATDDLEFDHIDRATKAFNVGGARVASRRRVMDEARKCQLLCREHHLEKSYKAGDLIESQHGTHAKYSHGCRCQPCTVAHRDSIRAYESDETTIRCS